MIFIPHNCENLIQHIFHTAIHTPELHHHAMKKRTVIITGATSGIGKTAAHRFAAEGHNVIMACRNLEKAGIVKQEIIDVSGNDQVTAIKLDVSSSESVASFCNTFRQQYPKLDVLIHNAAYFDHGASYKLSRDNLELTFATNVFGPFLMTHQLRDSLRKSDDARILHAGSNIIKHFFNPKLHIGFDNLQGEHPESASFKVYNSYRDSKMALLMLTFRMAREFEPDGIRVNMLQINGATMSEETLQRVTPGYRLVARTQNLFFRPPEFMAEHYLAICTSDQFRNVTGQLINHRREPMQPGVENPGPLEQIRQAVGADRYPRYALDKEEADNVWELCNRLGSTHLRFPG